MNRMPIESTDAELLEELKQWVRIPSISGVAGHSQDLLAAAAWTASRLSRFCTDVTVTDDDPPLVIGKVNASRRPAAGTYLIYGHYDVQAVGPGWTMEPFAAHDDGEWIYGRGTSDDKGQFLTLIRAVELLSEVDALGIDVVFLADGAEETLGQQSCDWLRKHANGITGGILYDSSFLDSETPVINYSTRGLVEFEISCTTGERNLHSGLAGGVALNAYHVLIDIVGDLLSKSGRLPEPLMQGTIPATAEEQAEWRELVPGPDILSAQGGRPADAQAADEYYLRTLALPSLEIHDIRQRQEGAAKTAIVTDALVRGSMRLAPGQSATMISSSLSELLDTLAKRYPAADVHVEFLSQTDPSFCAQTNALIEAGVTAFEQVWGRTPKVLRAGGTLPFTAALSEMGIPYLLSGLHLPEGNAHGPDEKFKLQHLYDGVKLSYTLLSELGGREHGSPENDEERT